MKKLLLILLLGAQSTVFAQSNYTQLNGPYGGGIEDLETWNSRLVGLVNGQGIVISEDGGATWTTSNNGITDPFNGRDLEKDPVSNKLYLVTFNRLYSSTDGGSNWIVVAQTGFSNAKKIELSPNGSLFIASSTGTIYRSTNGGATWPIGDVTTLPNSPGVTTFNISSTGFLFVGTQSNSIYRSNNPNSVLGFTQLTNGLSDSYIGSFAISGTTLYATTGQGIFKSTNNGDTWTSIKASGNYSPVSPVSYGMENTYFYNARIKAFGSTVLLMNSWYNFTPQIEEGLFWKSNDQGATWTETTHPMSLYGKRFSQPKDLFVFDANTYFASFQKGVFKTADGGTNWFEINNGITGFTAYDPNKLVMTDNGRLILAPNVGFGLFLSTDDGQSWDFLSGAPLNQQINGLKKIGSSIFAYGSGLMRSTDNGGTWTQVFSGSFLGCGSNFSYFDNTSTTNFYSLATYNCTAGLNQYNLLKSNDAGVTWTNHLISGIPENNAGYIVGSSGLKVDANGNAYVNFYNYNLSRYQLIKIDGSTYQATDVTPAGYTITDAFTLVNNKIFVTGFASGQMKILNSSDAGQTWAVKSIPYAYGRVRAISESTIYLLGSNATVYISTDGGDSWVDTGNFGTAKQAYDVIISPTNFSYVAINYGSVFKSNAQVIPPTAPTGLTIPTYSTFNLTLRWNDNSNNESYFVIERSEGNNTSYDSIGFQNASSLTFRIVNTGGLKENTLYFYRVRAVGAAGNSAYSNEASVTTLANCQNYTIPLNRSWTATTQTIAGSNNAVSISGGNGSYIISNLVNANAVSGITPVINSTVTVQILEVCGSVYMLPSTTVYGNGNGTWNAATNTLTIHWQTRPNFTPYRAETTVFTLNATDPPPGVPGNVGAYIKTSNEVVINWSASQFAQSYQVERSTTSGSGFVAIGSPITAAPFLYVDNTTFALGTTYYYRIKATSFGNLTPTYSSEVSIAYQIPRFNAISLVGFDFPTQGISWADIDNDGDDDLLVTPFNAFENGFITVFENDGAGNLNKINVPGVSDYNISTTRVISVGDINNDGFADFILNGPISGGEVFINNKNKSFTRSTLVPTRSSGFDWYASLADFNNDGRLDAVFTEDNAAGQPSATKFKFFTQNADGEFEPYELGEIAADASVSRAASWVDYDKDGDLDFLRSRYGTAATDFDQLYRNIGGGTFTPVTGTVFEADFVIASRSISWGDYDNDLDFDAYVVENNFGSNMLYRNNGDGTFTKMTSSLLSEAKSVQSFGSAWGDVDNDGDLDMVVANSLQGVLYLNDGVGNFIKYTAQEYLVASDPTRTNIAFAFSDYDNNGTLDIATGKNINNFPTILLKNTLTTGTTTRWLKVKLEGVNSNRAGIGARIEITTPNARRQMRAIESLSGYGSASSLTAHFGLGNQSTATVDVFWPSGLRQTITNVAANQTLIIPEDGTGPRVLLLLPANGEANVSSTTTLEITLDEVTTAVSGKRIILTKTSDPTNPILSTDVTNGTKTGNKYAFTLPTKLEQGAAYRISIEAGAFRDLYGNLSLLMAESAWSFTVGQGPQLTTLSPLNNSVSVNTNTKLDITYNGPVTGVAGKFLKVFLQNDLVNAITSIEANTAVITGNTSSFTLSNKLLLNTVYTVSLDAGAFRDAVQNESAAITAGTAWSFTTSAGPQVTLFQPTNGVGNVANNQSLSLTFSGNVSAVSGKSIRVDQGTTNILTIAATATSITNNIVTIAAPATNWPFLAALSVKIDQGAFVDNAGNDFAGISGNAWSFTIVEAPDVTAPSITYNPALISVLDKGFSARDVKVTATDNKNVTRVIMYHRKLTEQTAPNTIVLNVPPSSGNDWTFQVTNSMTDDMGFEYYFEAFDLAGNKTRNPLAEGSFHKSSLRFTSSNAPRLTLSGEGNLNSWRIIAVPYQLENGNFQIADVLQSFGTAGEDTWRLIRYDKAGATERWLEFPSFSAFERGKGYFINSLGLKEAVFNNAVAPNFDRNNLESINLIAGWNQIGNPYTVAINWEEVRAFNGATSNVGGLKLFTNGQYTNGTTLQPGQGGFVFVNTATVVDVPFLGQTQAGTRFNQPEFSTDLSANSWIMPLTIEHDFINSDMAGIGMHNDASLSKDGFDDLHAPRFLGYSEINFEHPEHEWKNFAKDIVPTAPSHIWSFAVNTNLEGTAVMKWDNSGFGDNDKQLIMVDEQNLAVIDMRKVNHYTFNPSESGRFKIYFGRNVMEQIGIETFSVSNAYPNPTKGETLIRFSLPANGGEKQLVEIEAKDAMGKHLGILSQRTLASGLHEVSFNASNLPVHDGLLLVTLSVSNDLGKSQKQIKVIVNR